MSERDEEVRHWISVAAEYERRLTDILAERDTLRKALEEIAKESYLDDFDLEFKPTKGAEIARSALTQGASS